MAQSPPLLPDDIRIPPPGLPGDTRIPSRGLPDDARIPIPRLPDGTRIPPPRKPGGGWGGGIAAWTFAVILLLLTWGLRVCCLETVPPGWRDDELINIHALSGELLEGRFPLYFTGASGHEPLYHWLHAGVHAVLGFNVLSGHLLSVTFGVLSVALTYALARRLFGRATAVVSSLALAVSFWSLMYSRTAIRHISLPPCALAAFYLFWRSIYAPHGPQFVRPWRKLGLGVNPRRIWLLVGLFVGLSVYIYPAARLLTVLLCLSMAHLALFHRERFKRYWRGFLLALAVVTLLAVPLGVAIAQGRSEAAAQGIGADARLAELAVPLRELRAGNPRPLLESTWITLGMFHTTGDSEWLYNISGRPVFNLLGGMLLWAGVVLCLCRWRRPRYFFLLLWLGFGLLPAFLSTPPASLSHTILAQPVVYILSALALTEAHRRLTTHTSQATICNTSLTIGPLSFTTRNTQHATRNTHYALRITQVIILTFLATNAIRDLRDYFVTWPQRGMVRFLYRADYRDVAHYLNAHLEITDVAVSSTLMGPWDRLALEVDTRRDVIAVRMFNPERVLVHPAGSTSHLILPLASAVDPQIQAVIDRGWHPFENDAGPFYVFVSSEQGEMWPQLAEDWVTLAMPHSFANGMAFLGWGRPEELPAAGRTVTLLTAWGVSGPLDMPPVPIVANPPPPGVYSGPRLAVFTHMLAADGTFLAGDDGLWVDPLTLRAGDRFLQLHRFALPPDAPPGPYTLELGLYDPLTGERWAVLESGEQPAADRLLLPLTE